MGGLAINNNDILRRIRYIFDYSDAVMLSIFELGGYQSNKAELLSWLAREDKPDFVPCEDKKLASFLNGLIIKNRGAKDDQIPEPEEHLNNNIVLRKLRIALELQAEDLLALTDYTLSKHELSAMFRRPDHKNYRECQNQFLRNVLDGLQAYHREDG
jgi:uncharacterized protein YehS (DUF1456 family)